MRIHQFIGLALVFFVISAQAEESIEVQMAKATEMSDFADKYQTHLQKREGVRGVRGQFKGNFQFAVRSCGIGSVNGFVSGIGINGKANLNQGECDCPRGNNKLGCLTKASATIKFSPADIGGKGYVLIYANDGDMNYGLIDGQWQDFRALKRGKASFIEMPITAQAKTYAIPFNSAMCGNSGMAGAAMMGGIGKRYNVYAGYGAADTMDLRFMELAIKNNMDIDREEFMWSAARLDGFRTKNAVLIGTVTCGGF